MQDTASVYRLGHCGLLREIRRTRILNRSAPMTMSLQLYVAAQLGSPVIVSTEGQRLNCGGNTDCDTASHALPRAKGQLASSRRQLTKLAADGHGIVAPATRAHLMECPQQKQTLDRRNELLI